MIVFNQYPLGETRVQREAEALLRVGYEVDVICKRVANEPSRDVYKGVRIYRQKFHVRIPTVGEGGLLQKFIDYFMFFFSALFQLNRLHSAKPYTSIQVHNLPDFLVFCTIIQKSKGVPVILDLHDLMPEFFAGRFGKTSSILARLILWQEHQSCRFADHVITVSEHWRQALLQRGVPATKCSVVMNVADDLIFTDQLNISSQKVENESFRLIYHGSLVHRYGLDLALQAVARLRDQIPGIQLFLIGQGEFLPDLVKLVDELNLCDQVHIEPKRLAEELPEIIRSCDIGIVPYRNDVFTDGLLPTKLMEYAAMGLPSVAARTSTIELYFTGTNVEFFEPGSVDDLVRCIYMLYNNPKKLTELRQNSKKFTERFNWRNISNDYINIVQSLSQTKTVFASGTGPNPQEHNL